MKKILIVDDSPFIRLVLRNILSEIVPGVQIMEEDSKDGAVKTFKKENPDLVLLDIIMREGDEEGVEALNLIMKTSSHANVLMITAIGNNIMIKRCMELGARGYIVKPFDSKQIQEAIKEYV